MEPRTTHPTAAAQARLLELLEVLAGAGSAGELLGRAADAAHAHLPFDRFLTLSVGARLLTAEDEHPLADPRSDRLRRKVLGRPLELSARTREAQLARAGRDPGPGLPTVIGAALELEHLALVPIVLADGVVAILACVADEPVPEDHVEQAEAFAGAVSFALQHVLMREQNRTIARELRYLITSAKALLDELAERPTAFPAGDRQTYVTLLGELPTPAASSLHALLTPREVEIAERLATGHTNREIAEALVVSPETVKGHVSRILRKLGAHTRSEAVARYLALSGG